MPITTAIIGASGYSGAELLKLLAGRADVTVTTVTGHASVGKKVHDLYPVFAGTFDAEFEPIESVLGKKDVDVVFLALRAEDSMTVAPALRESGRRVIDLSGAFRLQSPDVFKQYYKEEHTAVDILPSAVYGLPEINKEQIAKAGLIANPGCYPTSALLPLIPVLKERVISVNGVVIDSLSGVSGAGRSSDVSMSFAEVNENVRAYKLGNHQHIPEIESVLQAAAGSEIRVSFTPHLVPLTRGIYSTIHTPLAADVTEARLYELYQEFYCNAPFVRVRRTIPQIKDVVGTNYCDIHIAIDRRTNQLVLISVIDNLVKGAAGQAIQNMNIMFGLDETAGLR